MDNEEWYQTKYREDPDVSAEKSMEISIENMRPFINTKLNDPKPHEQALSDQLSPKQVRNTATTSLAVKRKHPN